jgi:uncharacterized protein (TIGR03437 family)
VSVSVNGQAAPVFFVSPMQINFQVPWATAIGTASVTVSVAGGASKRLFRAGGLGGSGLVLLGIFAAIVQNAADYSLNGPSHPAAAGSTIIAYLTGSGPVNPAATDGVAAPLTTLVVCHRVSQRHNRLGGGDCELSPDWRPAGLGLVQVNLVVPAGLAPGTYPLTVTIDGETSNAGNISVQ